MSDIIVKQGALDKEGGSGIKRWQSRTFILTRTSFSWFKPEDLRAAQGTLELGEITDVKRQVGESNGRRNILTVSCARKLYRLAAESREEQAEWIAALHPSTQASFAAKATASGAGASSSTATSAATTPAKEDKVLEAMLAAAKEMKGGGNSCDRRSTVLIPIVRDDADGGDGSDVAVTSPQEPFGASLATTTTASQATGDGAVVVARNASTRATGIKYAVVEVFISHGLRIAGPVSNQMFNLLGQGVPSDKKKLDQRGWFCDRSFTLCAVIQAFVTSGWVLHRLSHSTSATPWEPSQLHAINLAVFARGPGAKPLSMSESDTRQFVSHASDVETSLRGRNAGGAAGAGKRRSMLESAQTGLLPSEEAELRVLMEEFHIPLELLDVEAVQA